MDFNPRERAAAGPLASALLPWACMSGSLEADAATGHSPHSPAEAHPFCFVCSASNPMGLAVNYAAQADGSVTASFLGNCALEGYPGLLHGGVIAALLDGAMTHCLFVHGVRGFTVELKVRYHAGVIVAEESILRARLVDSAHGLFQLSAELTQGSAVKVRATGKFMTRHE